MQGIGFTDEIGNETIEKIEEALRSKLRRTTPPVVTFHRPVILPEAIYLPAMPIQDLQAACRTAITTTQTIDPDSRPYRPHISIAYVNGESPNEHIAQSFTMTDTDAVEVTISHVSLMVFHRDRRMYEWTKAIHIPIGDNPA